MTTGSFTNPVIPGFHPDPSVCRVGDEYFLAASSFTYFPGVPIFRSPNLVDWTQIGNVLDRPDQLDLGGTEGYSSLGVFAPTLRHHDGRFWVITTVFRRQGSQFLPDNFLVTSRDPAGPWSGPTRLELAGIDPDLAWDEEGRCWVHYSGPQRIDRCLIRPETGRVLEGPEPTWSGTGLQYPEAPHLFQRDGNWYLLIAEGGTERGHAVSIARGPSPTGPWEGCPHNPILSHRSTRSPIQNTGHADLVEAPDGTWWMLLLGTRPRGVTPMFHVLGRETFLAPVEWQDGWPRVQSVTPEISILPPRPLAPGGPGLGPGALGPGGPASEVMEAEGRDDFDGPDLDRRWLAVRRSAAEFARLDQRPGWLTLAGGPAGLDADRPVLIARRQQHLRCRASTLMDLGQADEAGLVLRMDEKFHYAIGLTGSRIVCRAAVGGLASVVGAETRPDGPVALLLETRSGGFGPPDTVVMGYRDGTGQSRILGQIDGRFLSTEVAGGMLGRVIGLYAVGGDAHFDWFEYSEAPPP